MSDEHVNLDDEFTAIVLLRRKVQNQVLDWAAAMDMASTGKGDPLGQFADKMREWLRSL